MTSMITPPVMTNATAQSAAQAGARNRAADDDQGRSFGAALERSRANTGEAAQGGTQDAAALDRKPVRKPGADEDTKDEGTLPADPNLAFLAPANTALHALTLAGRAARKQGGDGAADAAAVATTPAKTATDIPLDPALQAPAAKTLAGDAASTAADAKAVPEAAAAAKDSAAKPATPALPGTEAAAAQPDAAQATSLHELARAAIAAQTMSTGFAKPASAPAGAPVGTAATGRGAGSRAPMSATTAEQLASAAQPTTTGDAQADKAAPAVVTAAAAGSTDSQPDVSPTALQQPAPVTTAPSEHANEATATARAPVHTIAPEVGSDKWAPALGQHLARMSASGSHTAELNLNPAGLGPLKVTLSMGDNQAQAMFVSAHESVRKAVEAALPQLRNSLSEQGITLGQTSVGAETRQPFGNGAAFAQQQGQQQQQNAARQQAASSYPGASRPVGSASAATAAVRPAAPDHARSGVDTFA
ncbi:flagellar hook-length control protein FliK [Variovorax sp. NFACC27]|uniref:flagellar hook-length control protein FliK n=1 Tax=unclassified Variovorax TaxID=663243 RepID=UPI00089C5ECC|nr:flagellar hook-length control protein FliK [Variovorax sp. NFACC28]SEG61886.1 flagellar hook-length control protein FliK [Variovorax sp. NFACC29]SFC62518.1 flagellar hook-length control protein FliK [Variovorax sp. NFACC26]SFG68742.1 flagellar hook-length control protein FliK [Variovorax sp. NFACC27]